MRRAGTDTLNGIGKLYELNCEQRIRSFGWHVTIFRHYGRNRHCQPLFFCGKYKSIPSIHIWKAGVKAANSKTNRLGFFSPDASPSQTHWIMEIARTIFKSTEMGNSLINWTELDVGMRVCIHDHDCIELNENKLGKMREKLHSRAHSACDDVDWIVSIVYVLSASTEEAKFYSFNQIHSLFPPPKHPGILYQMKMLLFRFAVEFLKWSRAQPCGHARPEPPNAGQVDWCAFTEIQSKSIFRPIFVRRETRTKMEQKLWNGHQFGIRNVVSGKLELRWKEVHAKWRLVNFLFRTVNFVASSRRSFFLGGSIFGIHIIIAVSFCSYGIIFNAVFQERVVYAPPFATSS